MAVEARGGAEPVRAGLEGVIAAETALSRVDGRAGRLVIAGYELEELAPKASFEQVIFLLWHGRMPNAIEAEDLRGQLATRSELAPETLQVLRGGVARGATPIETLRMGVASLLASSEPRQLALDLVAKMPSMVAAASRWESGLEPLVSGHETLVERFLNELRGESPSSCECRALETYLNTVVDHGFNASTFTARVIISTRSDLVSAVTGAIGALKGPLHGGAPGPVLETLLEIATPERAEAILRAKLENGDRLMGFGHRIYEVRDPRAEVLRAAARDLLPNDSELLALADAVEAVALRLLRERKPGKRIETNVEFYTALLLHALRLPPELFTAIFAMGRVVGWCAHCFEQLDEGRLIRPRARYVGPEGLVLAANDLPGSGWRAATAD